LKNQNYSLQIHKKLKVKKEWLSLCKFKLNDFLEIFQRYEQFHF
jgi:hypothetical protein